MPGSVGEVRVTRGWGWPACGCSGAGSPSQFQFKDNNGTHEVLVVAGLYWGS